MAKMPSSSSSRRRGTEEGEGASAPVNPGGQGLDGGPGQGKKERVGRRFDPRPHLVPGWSVAVRPRKPAAARVSERRRRCRVAERGRGVAARFEAVGVVLGEGSAASLIGGQGGGEMLAGGKLAGGLMAWGGEALCGVNGGSE